MISIIIPCYNASAFLDDCMTSLTEQTYKDFEVICINDGSGDDTLQILKQYLQKDEFKLQIIDKENQGVSAARNDGLEAASGEYILFLDADDKYHPRFVERLFFALRESCADAAYCTLDRDLQKVFETNDFDKKYVVCDRHQTMENHRLRITDINFYCFIFRRDIIMDQNIRFAVGTKFGEDREFLWKYLCHCEKAAFIDAPLYWYRVNESSATKRKPTWSRNDIIKADARVKEYMELHCKEYAKIFWNYMFPRTVLSLAKDFSVAKDLQLFLRLQKEYDVKDCMKKNLHDPNKLVAVSALCYLIHPKLFYFLIGLKK